MTATITLQDRRLDLPISDEQQLRHIVAAVANGTGEQFRVRRPSPDGRKRMVVFTTDKVVAINANGLDLTDYASPVTYRTEQVAA